MQDETVWETTTWADQQSCVNADYEKGIATLWCSNCSWYARVKKGKAADYAYEHLDSHWTHL